MLTTQNKSMDLIGFSSKAIILALIFLFSTTSHASDLVRSTVLYFDEIEAGVESYTTRFIIAGEIIRIDEGHATDSFVLFNSTSGALFSVVHSDQSILKIPLMPKLAVPRLQQRFDRLSTRLELVSDNTGPTIAGIQAMEYELKAGENVCARFSAIDGLLDAELEVMQAYEKALLANNTHNIGNQPPEYITDCMLVNELFASDLYLSKGFPIMFMEENGQQRFLKNYKQDEEMEAALFKMPKGYAEFTLDEKIGL